MGEHRTPCLCPASRVSGMTAGEAALITLVHLHFTNFLSLSYISVNARNRSHVPYLLLIELTSTHLIE